MPKFEPDNPASIKRLLSAVDWSLGRLRDFREDYVDFEKRRVGAHFGSAGFSENRPLNGFELGANIYQRVLNSHEPQALISGNRREFTPTAADFELALNQEIKRINLGDAFDTCVLSAINRLGVMEVGITGSDTPPDGEGYLYDPGHLFADPVLFDDLILDMSVKTWEQMSYIGHEFSVPFEWVKENSSFNKHVRDTIKTPDSTRAITSDQTGESSQGAREEFDESTRLRQLYLFRYGLVLLFAVEQQENLPLKIVKWKGPEKGPYRRLSFGKVLGEIIPLSPMMNWFDLDDITNTSFNKAADQAERQKTVVGVTPAGADDGKAVLDAQDGDMIKLVDPKNVAEIRLGGADQVNLGMALWSLTKLKEFGGNWDAIGGLGPMSETATQDQQIVQSASGRMEDLIQTTNSFKSAVIRDLAFWQWHNPIAEWPIQKPIGAGRYIDATFAPENRAGDFSDFTITLNVNAGRKRSPAQQGEFLLQRLERFYLQVAPLMQQMGMTLDWEAIIKTLAKYDDTPEVNDWVQYMNGEMLPASQSTGMPPSTTRTYERVNKSQATPRGQDQALMSMLMGGNKQPTEMSNIVGAA